MQADGVSLDSAHDVLGVGFGPSNLALAIALRERTLRQASRLNCSFIEKQAGFAWHANMLLDDSRMQISFLKDLATLRDPTSPFTFINYLHRHGRLEDFINLKTFFPVRAEYNHYLQWAAAHFEENCAYGEEVTSIEPLTGNGTVKALRVVSHTTQGSPRMRLARNLVLAVGGTAQIPEVFAKTSDSRIFHSSTYLECIPTVLGEPAAARRIAVIGGGQSAAEIFLDLQRFPQARIDLISRAAALQPADDSPLRNEIFHPQFIDVIYRQTPQARAALIREFRATNYGAIDLALIEKIHELLYLQKLTGKHRHGYLRGCDIRGVHAAANGVQLSMHLELAGVTESRCYDAVILATGYERHSHHTLLKPLHEYLESLAADRNYRLPHRDGFLPEIYLQGSCEPTHGLADTLLSILAIRSKEIADSLIQALAQQRSIASAAQPTVRTAVS